MTFVTGSRLIYSQAVLYALILDYRNSVLWYTDPKNRIEIDGFNENCISLMRGPDKEKYVDYQSATRVAPIERRFRGAERLARLKSLKKEWDPKGIFTNQLLD